MKFAGQHFFFALVVVGLCGTCIAQAPAGRPAATPPSALIQPALGGLEETLDVLRPEKWKAPAGVREETAANINSIRRDLATTLPPLLTTADTSPDSVARILPAYRNIEALYDVVLRVTETGNLSAPSQQAAMLAKALADLESGRKALGDRMQAAAVAHDQQVHDLQAAIRAKPPAPTPAPAVCPSPPMRKRRARPKTTHKPTAPATSSSQSQPSPH